MEGDRYILKFYSFNAYFEYGNEHSRYGQILQLKKEFPQLSKENAVLEATKK